ncbi:helix-turn-helix domain-containing protein [Paludisphaera mucosa]|uniref:AraC family transcriptional regulator n=1 Tax=Paludisphaera mucosa TaxID=3030827 RepID=A0ABT6FIB2_9BACT|nr:AraC family transcriptional regulator [Paludisphaera mucosa]MDG3007108.1 AraC family transcriptional regulator [Paludisphaera mucosa]
MSSVAERSGEVRPRPPRWPESMPVVASTEAAIGTIGHAAILEGRLPDLFHVCPTHTAIAFGLKGTSTIERRRGGRLSRFVGGPGGFTIIAAGEDNRFSMDRPLQTLNLIFDAGTLQVLADREWPPCGSTIAIASADHQTTPEIVTLGQQFASLLRSPRNGGRLYAETLWTQIAIQLLWNFSSLPRPQETWVERLPDVRLKRVIDYLDASVAEEISLGDLADLAGLSPNYFLNAFKKATGKTPHRFLTEKRVAKACDLLRNPQTSIVGVALAVGFSSQSHFTTVFGRFMKTTPAAYRAQVLGLGPEPTSMRGLDGESGPAQGFRS